MKNTKTIMIIVLLVLASALIAGCKAPNEVEVSLDYPVTLAKGNEFNMTITIDNNDDKDHVLKDIDVNEEFVEGIAFVKIMPKTVEQYYVWGLYVYEFQKKIVAHSQEKIVLSSKAVKQGDFSGEIGVCIDSDTTCIDNIVRIVVE